MQPFASGLHKLYRWKSSGYILWMWTETVDGTQNKSLLKPKYIENHK